MHLDPVVRFLCRDMSYHAEHRVCPTVPCRHPPKLHALPAGRTPPAYPGSPAVRVELIPALLRQKHEPGNFVERPLPG